VLLLAQVSACRNEVWRLGRQQEEANHALQELLVTRTELEGDVEALERRSREAKEAADDAQRSADECRARER
jgi:hypothetical protein